MDVAHTQRDREKENGNVSSGCAIEFKIIYCYYNGKNIMVWKSIKKLNKSKWMDEMEQCLNWKLIKSCGWKSMQDTWIWAKDLYIGFFIAIGWIAFKFRAIDPISDCWLAINFSAAHQFKSIHTQTHINIGMHSDVFRQTEHSFWTIFDCMIFPHSKWTIFTRKFRIGTFSRQTNIWINYFDRHIVWKLIMKISCA